MAKRLIEHDAFTGVSTFHEYDPSSDTTYIQHVQDVEGILKHNKRLANDSSYKRKGIKEDWYHFASVPNVVVLELKTKHNLDIFNPDDMKKIEQVLVRDYKKLLTVDKI